MAKKKNRVNLRATITIDYDADPAIYRDGAPVTPSEMAAIDERNMTDDPKQILEMIDMCDFRLIVSVV